MRWFTAKQVKEQFHASAQADGIEVSEEPEVSFGSSPLIFGLAKGEIFQLNLHTPSTLQINGDVITGQPESTIEMEGIDRKSTRLNSSHVAISYAVFCLKKKRATNYTE